MYVLQAFLRHVVAAVVQQLHLVSLVPHGLHDLGLGGDGGVVGAGQPQGRVALHALPADEDVLQGLVPGVAHVQLARDVGRRDDDGVGLLFGVYFRVEIAALHPKVVDAALHLLGLVGFRKLF